MFLRIQTVGRLFCCLLLPVAQFQKKMKESKTQKINHQNVTHRSQAYNQNLGYVLNVLWLGNDDFAIFHLLYIYQITKISQHPTTFILCGERGKVYMKMLHGAWHRVA